MLAATDLSDYLFARSTGHIGSPMTLINRGCLRAIRSGREYLDRDLLDAVRPTPDQTAAAPNSRPPSTAAPLTTDIAPSDSPAVPRCCAHLHSRPSCRPEAERRPHPQACAATAVRTCRSGSAPRCPVRR